MGSSFPKDQDTKQKKKKKKKKPRADCKLAQKKYRTKNYMVRGQFKCHAACSNAVKLSSNEVQVHKIGLSIEFLKNWPIDHHTR